MFNNMKTMKREFKIITLFLIFNFGGCCSRDCDNIPKFINIEGFDVNVKTITNIYGDGSISSTQFDTNNLIDYDKVLIELQATTSYFGQTKSFDYSNLFISSAYACKCDNPGYQGSTEHISDIIILSSNPFLSTSSSSDTISQFFNISGFNGNQFFPPTDLVSFISTQPRAMSRINLTLKAQPTGSNEHSFTIIYKQTNGEVYELATPTVKFN